VRNILLASISHDFRTPLASILGCATALIDYRDRLDAAARDDLLAQVRDEARHLDQMVRNLLSMTRTAVVTAGPPLDLRERPAANARLAYRAAPGVVGKLSECAGGWCRFDVMGQAGYAQVEGLWGVEPGERIP